MERIAIFGTQPPKNERLPKVLLRPVGVLSARILRQQNAGHRGALSAVATETHQLSEALFPEGREKVDYKLIPFGYK